MILSFVYLHGTHVIEVVRGLVQILAHGSDSGLSDKLKKCTASGDFLLFYIVVDVPVVKAIIVSEPKKGEKDDTETGNELSVWGRRTEKFFFR